MDGADQGSALKGKFVACCSNHTILISLDNTVYSFGRDDGGQLGLDLDVAEQTLISKVLSHVNIPTQVRTKTGEPVKAKFAACGDLHTILIRTIGSS